MATIQILQMASWSESARAVSDLLSSQPDMVVIEAPPSRGIELLALLRRTEAEVLMVESSPDATVPLCAQVLSEYPHLVILAVSPDDRAITLNRLRVESQTLTTASLVKLPGEVRAAVES